MRTLDAAIIGSGMGGSLSALLYQGKNVIVFEKDGNLGGCACTFKRYGHFFNAGATTVGGYEDGKPFKKLLDEHGIKPELKACDVAYRTIQNGKILDRHKDFEKFLTDLEKIYPHPGNRKFWETIRDLDNAFWKLKHVYFGKHSILQFAKTSLFLIEMLTKMGLTPIQNAQKFIDKTLPGISQEYQRFIDSSLLITVQSSASEIPLLSMALGMAYPFHGVYYPIKGMGNIVETILEKKQVHIKEPVFSIERSNDGYVLHSQKESYFTKELILNVPVYDCANLFVDKKIQDYYLQFEFSDQSAFVVYLTLQTNQKLIHHYQIILDEKIPNTLSSSFFVSVGDKDDPKMGEHGISVTISTHTEALFWKNLSKDEYKSKKAQTQSYIIEKFLEVFDDLDHSAIQHHFSATSTTFKHYLGRMNCGGKTIGLDNIDQLPSCTTPFKGLYNVGDSVFAGQGWPGVALGVSVLQKELHAKR